MSDGTISIKIDVDGKQIDVAKKGLDDLGKSAPKGDPLKGLNDGLKETESKTTKATFSFKNMAASLGVFTVATAALNVMKSAIGGAVERFDTMQKFPNVMKSLGYSTAQSTESINKLSDGIEGLPTTLNEAVSQTQQFVATTGSLDKATDTVIALNNAFLASGASVADTSRGMTQYNQMLARGKVDMAAWHTLQETMPTALDKVAKSFGLTTTTMYDALRDGNITFDELNKRMIELGTGTGELVKLARENSAGIATSFNNLRNAVTKNLANMLTTIDQVVKAVSGKTIAENLNGLKGAVNNSFKVINNVMLSTIPVVKLVFAALGKLLQVSSALSPVLIGVATGFAAWKIINSITTWIKAANSAITTFTAANTALSLTIKAVATAEELSSGATKASTVARMAQSGQLTVSTALYGLLTGAISASTVASTIATTAITALKAALAFLTGPIGLVVAGIGALTAALVFNNKAAKESKEKAEKQVKAYKELNQSIEGTRSERTKNLAAIDAENKVSDSLISSLDKLTSKEKVSKTDKQEIGNTIEQLNKKYTDLNLSYNEETGMLNQSIDLVKAKTAAYQEQSKLEAYNQALNDNLKEQIQLESQSAALKKKIAAIEKDEKENVWQNHRQNIDALKEYNGQLDESQKQLKLAADEEVSLRDGQTKAMNAYSEAAKKASSEISNYNGNLTVSYDELEKSGQQAMDMLRDSYENLKKTAGDAFDAIKQKQTISVQEMMDNMLKNQQAIQEWGTNLATLTKRGLDEGIIQQLRDGGPQMAQQTALMVDMSDEELQKMNGIFSGTTTTALQGMLDAYGKKAEDFPPQILAMIQTGKLTMQQAIAEADFGQYGTQVVDEFKQGADNSAASVQQSGANLANNLATGITLNSALPKGAANVMGIDTANALANGNSTANANGQQVANNFAGGLSSMSVLPQNVANVLGVSTAGALSSANNGATANGNAVSSNFAGGITSSSSLPQGAASVLGTQAAESLSSALPNANSKGAQLASQMGTGISNNANTPTKASANMAKDIMNATDRLPNDANSRGSKVSNQMGTGISNNSNVAKNAADNMANKVQNATSTASNGAERAGRDVGQGLANGITSKIEEVGRAAARVAKNAVDSAKSLLGIHSPSRVFRDEVGRFIPEGLAIGIDKNAATAVKSSQRMANDLFKPFDVLSASGATGLVDFQSNNSSGRSTNISNKTSNNPVYNMQVTWNNKEDIRKTMREISWQTDIEGRGRLT